VNLIEAVLMFLSRNKHPESPLNEMHDLFSPISPELFASGGSALIECIIGPDEACASRFLQWRLKVSEVTSRSQPEWQNWIRTTAGFTETLLNRRTWIEILAAANASCQGG